MSEVMVSVCMITYNHEAFIREALDGVLMQQTSFPYELVIGEDCSTDRTREICIEYQQKHPEKIRLLLNEKNLGMMPNFIQTLKACTGKYIALCEGDDYWTDPLKLQKQVDFLEGNEEYVASVHPSQIIYDNIKEKNSHTVLDLPQKITIELLLESRFFHTNSLIFKNSILKSSSFPKIFYSGDRAIFLLIGAKGPLHFFSEVMSVYRKNSSGVSQKVTLKEIEKDLHLIPWLKTLKPNLKIGKFRVYLYKTMVYVAKKENSIKYFKYFVLLFVSIFRSKDYSIKDFFYLVFKKI